MIPRPVSVGILILLALGLFALMWVGWRRSVRRTALGLQLSDAVFAAAPTLSIAGTYVSTTRAGEWLQRVTAQDLGVRSPVVAQVSSDGVSLRRQGARDVMIPRADLHGARAERGIAGKVTGTGDLIVLRWRGGEVELDTGLTTRHAADRDALIAAINDISAKDGA